MSVHTASTYCPSTSARSTFFKKPWAMRTRARSTSGPMTVGGSVSCGRNARGRTIGPATRWGKNDRKSAVLLTGYQVEDTNGRMLVDTGSIELEGEVHHLQCEVCQFDFSAHAGHDELVRFAEGSGAEEVILVHGDRREELEKDLSGSTKVRLPLDTDVYDT